MSCSQQGFYGGPAETLAEHRDEQTLPRGPLSKPSSHWNNKLLFWEFSLKNTPFSDKQTQLRASVPKELQMVPLHPGVELASGQMDEDQQGGLSSSGKKLLFILVRLQNWKSSIGKNPK